MSHFAPTPHDVLEVSLAVRCDALQAAGAEIVQEPTAQPYGVRDPAGAMIRIQEQRRP